MSKTRTALITGCNGGVGKTLCRAFVEAGFRVLGIDRKPEPLADCSDYLGCDLAEVVMQQERLAWFRDEVVGLLSKHNAVLAVIVNNAALQIVNPLSKLSVADFAVSQQVNLIAPFALAKIFEPELRAARGAIVNIGSIHARMTKSGFCAYSTSKAGLVGLTRALALEFGGDVRVNSISPAAVRTEMLVEGFQDHPERLAELGAFHPAGRISEPEEIARLVLFLCSDEARFITGADIAIDGGIGGRLHDPA